MRNLTALVPENMYQSAALNRATGCLANNSYLLCSAAEFLDSACLKAMNALPSRSTFGRQGHLRIDQNLSDTPRIQRFLLRISLPLRRRLLLVPSLSDETPLHVNGKLLGASTGFHMGSTSCGTEPSLLFGGALFPSKTLLCDLYFPKPKNDRMDGAVC